MHKDSSKSKTELIFDIKSMDLDRLIWSLAYKLQIEGVLEPDDLHQHGLMTLHELLTNDKYSYLDPFSDEFDYFFRKAAYHDMIDRIMYHKRGIRDWRNTLIDSQMTNGDGDASFLDTVAVSNGFSPDSNLFKEDDDVELESFLSDLKEVLSPEALILLDELLNPPPLNDAWIKSTWERVPSGIEAKRPAWMVADSLGWTMAILRKHLYELRQTAANVATYYNWDWLLLVRA